MGAGDTPAIRARKIEDGLVIRRRRPELLIILVRRQVVMVVRAKPVVDILDELAKGRQVARGQHNRELEAIRARQLVHWLQVKGGHCGRHLALQLLSLGPRRQGQQGEQSQAGHYFGDKVVHIIASIIAA